MNLSKAARKPVLVVTGGIGSGKSKVCEILSKYGATVVSADALARLAIPEVKTEIQSKFKEAFLNDGTLDRKKLGEIVFSDKAKKQVLEKILHPIIQKLADAEFDKAIKNGSKVIVYECPLFFESGFKKEDYRGLIVVDTPDEIAISRACIRDGGSKESVQKTMATQVDRAERRCKADFIIDNSGSLEELETQVLNIVKKLR